MEPRISLITLGVAGLERATRFFGLPRLQTTTPVPDGFLWEVAHNPGFPCLSPPQPCTRAGTTATCCRI
jgi:hypothetical protein